MTETATDTETPTPTPTATSTPCGGDARYWVGGAGSADDPSHWSCTSGGAGGASVPACVPAGDTYQGANDCVWDQGSGLGETFSDLFSTGLCCRNVDWSAIEPVLNTYDPNNQFYEPRARFTDGYIVSGGIQMSWGVGFHWGAGPLRMTAATGTHEIFITELPVGGGIDGGIDFHGSGTYGDDAVWNMTDMGGFGGRIGYAAHNITMGYGTLRINGTRLEGWDLRSGHGSDPSDSFRLEAGSATPNENWPQNNSINAWHSWSIGSDFDAGTSTVWCGGTGGTWGHGTCSFDGGGQTYFNVSAALIKDRQYVVTGNATVTHRMNVFTHPCWGEDCDPNDPLPEMIVAAGSTQSVQKWTVGGTAEIGLVLKSSQAGQPWTLNCTGYACGGDYMDLSDSICTGNTPCYAGTHSTVDSFSLAHGWVQEEVPPPPGCCAFTGYNMLAATCLDAQMLGGGANSEVTLDVCNVIQQTMLPFDQVLYFNPEATCAPEAGDMQGYCPPLDPTTPTPTPATNGCCVLNSECTMPEGAPVQPVAVTGGVCMDSSMLGGETMSAARCTTGASFLGCTQVRFIEGGSCDTDCVEPTATPTPTPTATATPTEAIGNCESAARYWVGGEGSADDSSHWSCTSGGEGGADVPLCVAVGDTYQGANDCIWDAASGLGESFANLYSEGLCCRNVDWSSVEPMLNTNDPNNQYYEPRARFTDGFIVSGGITMAWGIGFHWGASRLVMTASGGTHTLVLTELPVGEMTHGGIDFHGTGTYGDAATWSLDALGGFDGRIGWGHDILLGYGTLKMNGLRLEGLNIVSTHEGEPADAFILDAGSAAPNNTWPQNNTINAFRSWDIGNTTFLAGSSTVWCGGAGGSWNHGVCTFNGSGHEYFKVAAGVLPGREYVVAGNATIGNEWRVFTQPCQGEPGVCQEEDPPAAMVIEAGSTQTVSGWNVQGNSNQRLTISSSAAGQPWTLSCQSPPCVSDYIDLTDSICSGNPPCYAGTHSTADSFSLANGWSLSEPPPSPTPTPRPNDCSVGANLCALDGGGSCADCIALHTAALVDNCVAEIACTNQGCQEGSCNLSAPCAATLVQYCAEACRCLPTPTPSVSPTSTPEITPATPPSFVEFESGQVRPLAMSPAGNRLFAVNTPDGRLEIFDIGSNGTLTSAGSVPVGLEPVAVAARSNDEVWVVNHLSDSISIVDVGSTPPQVTRTLLVGDEPRDIVFAGSGLNRAFITTAHRGQNDPNDPQLLTPGIGRADVWVFDAEDLGESMEGSPLTKITLFSDTPRALAVTADGSTVFAAAFHSGNRTASVSAGLTTSWIPEEGSEAICPDRQQPTLACFITDLPEPRQSGQPFTSLIVKQREGDDWVDRACDGGPRDAQFCTVDADCADGQGGGYECGRNWNRGVMFNLPDKDVFAIDADADPPAQVHAYAGVGTILFNMAVNPVNGKVYVTNTEANNDVRFEGFLDPEDPSDSSVQGHLHESRITVLDSTSVTPRRLNKHIDYAVNPAPSGVKEKTLAQPTGIVISSDGTTAYVAALGSSKVGIFSTSELESDSFTPSAASQISLEGGGPTGLVLDESRHRLYVMTRFDNGISSVDIDANSGTFKQETRYALHNPEPASVIAGRKIFYDASFSSSNGEAACASCHVFGDFDSLAWDLGNPDGATMENHNPQMPGLGNPPPFHAMKGPMITQTLRGLVDHGPMHWRGDRSGAGDEGVNPFDPFAAFMKFNGAFVSLLGRENMLTNEEMASFTDFILQVINPPNPIRHLDNSLTSEQQVGADFFFNNRSDGGSNRCNSCHTVDPSRHLFGTNRATITVGLQAFKVAQFRNLYQKVGMFGQPEITTPAEGVTFNTFDSTSTGDQVRGFGYLHDGTIDDLFRFMQISAFNEMANGQPEGFHVGPSGDTQRRGVAMFLLAADTNLAPIVGQQVTLRSDNSTVVDDRLDLLIARCGTSAECDLVVKGTVDDHQRGWVLNRSTSQFDSDLSEESPLSDSALRAIAATSGQDLTYTAVPVGSGRRMGIDRDLDSHLDGDELAANSDPADPQSVPQ